MAQPRQLALLLAWALGAGALVGIVPGCSEAHPALGKAPQAPPTPNSAKPDTRRVPWIEGREPTAAVKLTSAPFPPVTVRVELAITPPERQQGLMYRRQLGADRGMLFVWGRPQQLSFWMRNTYIPLDLIFIRSDFTVLGVVENATPLTDDARQVRGESQFVLEVNAGFAQKHAVKPGTHVDFVDVPGFQGANELP